MTQALAEQSCVPCRGGIPPLSLDDARQFLEQAPTWQLLDAGGRLERTVWFSNFRESLAFVGAVGELAEAEGHHPDITFGWGYATISLRTKKIKGLHQNDFIMAAKIDRLALAHGGQENRRERRGTETPPATSGIQAPNDARGSAEVHHR